MQELAIRYGFPSVRGPSNFWIGIVELGGGWSEDDLGAYCEQLRIDTPKTDTTTLRGFDGSYTGEPAAAHRMYEYCSADLALEREPAFASCCNHRYAVLGQVTSAIRKLSVHIYDACSDR